MRRYLYSRRATLVVYAESEEEARTLIDDMVWDADEPVLEDVMNADGEDLP